MGFGFAGIETVSAGTAIFLFVIALWEVVWKGVGLWKAARSGHAMWFVSLLIFNTAGILPIIYLLFFQNKEEKVPMKVQKAAVSPAPRSAAKRRRRRSR